jgi:glycosyltransferase involved in cell wall biosynthesis
MASNQPLVSVLVTTYNHEKYIREAVQSILAQTFEDWEAVIIDDGSTDRTGEVVRAFTDPRVRYLWQANQGPSVATTTALAACRGKYVALMSGDDMLEPERLQCQLEAYQRGGRRVLFGGVSYVDDDGRHLEGQFHPEIVQGTNPSRAELLERLFFGWPSFFGVTAFTELAVLLECGPDDPALYQTQDYARWVHLLKQYDFEILPQRMYKFRIRAGESNLSGGQADKQVRAQTERYLVMKFFFRGMPLELFRDAFRRYLINPEFSSRLEAACEEAFLCVKADDRLTQLLGVEKLYQLLHDPETRDILKDMYHFSYQDFAEALKSLDITNQWKQSMILVNEGRGWNHDRPVRLLLNPAVPFHLVFDLRKFGALRSVAWIPFEELRLGRLRIEHFRYVDVDGVVHEIDGRVLASHGCKCIDDWWVFERPDPRLFFTPPGPGKRIEITGRLELLSHHETISRLVAAPAVTREAIVSDFQTGLGSGRSFLSRLGNRARRSFKMVRELFSSRRKRRAG